MTIPRFDRAGEIALTRDDDVLERVAALLQNCALRRQLWLMFLDERDHQLPLIMPTYIPRRPDLSRAKGLSRMLGVLFEDAEADTMIVVYERRGPDELSPPDLEWLRLVRDACREASIPLRGPILCHSDGVRWVGPDDLGE